jgi:hypothetical protein
MATVDSNLISVAINLGWRLAELYNSAERPGPAPTPPEPAPLPAHLPGAGEMSAYEKASALVDHIESDLQALGSALGSELLLVITKSSQS